MNQVFGNQLQAGDVVKFRHDGSVFTVHRFEALDVPIAMLLCRHSEGALRQLVVSSMSVYRLDPDEVTAHSRHHGFQRKEQA